MTGFAISVIAVLLVVFIIIATEAILRNQISYIITNPKDDADNIEARLRIILKENPTSDIIIINKTQSEETNQILSNLSRDFPQLHIVKADR